VLELLDCDDTLSIVSVKVKLPSG